MKDLSNKIYSFGDCYLKIGQSQDQQSFAGTFCELLDFVGDLKKSNYILGDIQYQFFGYSEIEKFQETTQDEFNKALAAMIRFKSLPKDDAFNLDFKRTEERIAILRNLMKK